MFILTHSFVDSSARLVGPLVNVADSNHKECVVEQNHLYYESQSKGNEWTDRTANPR